MLTLWGNSTNYSDADRMRKKIDTPSKGDLENREDVDGEAASSIIKLLGKFIGLFLRFGK